MKNSLDWQDQLPDLETFPLLRRTKPEWTLASSWTVDDTHLLMKRMCKFSYSPTNKAFTLEKVVALAVLVMDT